MVARHQTGSVAPMTLTKSLKGIKFQLHLLLGLIKTLKNWPQYLWFHFSKNVENKEFLAKLRDGARFYIRKGVGDMVAVIEVFYERHYYLDPRLVTDEKLIIVDVGAQVGTFSIFASQKANNALIYSYEPDAASFSQLLKNIKLNGLESRIKAFELAVWKERGQRKLYYRDDDSLGRSFLETRGQSFYVVGCLALKDIFELNRIEKCDLLKMDIEGAEYEVLLSIPGEVYEKIDRIYVEFHRVSEINYTDQDLQSFLSEQGFIVSRHAKLNILYATKKSQPFSS